MFEKFFSISIGKMKVLTVDDKVASVGKDNVPTVDAESSKIIREELNRWDELCRYYNN